MKILKLVLRNFSAIYKTMETEEISIDLSQCINNVCLLIGPNGSGKTTLLSQLQPFADVGNLDVRNGNNLILKDKEGYKEIQIKKDNDIYTIKHFYFPHKDKNHSVKSYIMKNDVELNVNGNVSSFKELVKIELQIEPDYLKLIRIGNNVSSLINLTTTERKNFMGKTMDEIGIYLEYYKAVNNKLRQLDDMISHNVDKMNKLNIVDKKEAQQEIDELKNELDLLMESFVNCNNKVAIITDSINNIDDNENIKDNLKSITKKYNKMTEILERKDKIESFEVSFYEKKIRDLELSINSLENEVKSNTMIIQSTLQNLDSLQTQYRTLEIQLKKDSESNKEIERMTKNLNNIRLKLREYESILDGFTVDFSKSELDNFITFLKNTQDILRRTYEFGKPPIEKVIQLIREKKNVLNYINKHLISLDDKTGYESSVFISTLASRFLLGGKNEIVIDCKEECIAKNVFIQLQNIIRTEDVKDKHENVSFYHDMEFVYKNISSVLPRFSEYKDIIDKLPNKIKDGFLIDNIYNKISSLDNIYDVNLFNDFYSLCNEYYNYVDLSKQYDEEKDNIDKFSSLSQSGYIHENIKTISTLIKEAEDKIKEMKNRNSHLMEKIDEDKRTLEISYEVKETIEKYDEVKSLYKKYTEDFELYNKLKNELYDLDLSIRQHKFDIDNLQNTIQKKISELDQYKVISKELNKMNKIYDEMTLTKDSLSSKQGIPLYFISQFLSNIEVLTNELLEIVYNGDLFIDQFNITPTEFSIPFYTKGVRLEDVKFASQGELSFLSIALSFALSSQILSKYNVMLLDEIDGTLDTNNRYKFIKILEKQIERINSEQSFLITHNNMFSSYPVDIIDLSFTDDVNTSYAYANFIKVERK